MIRMILGLIAVLLAGTAYAGAWPIDNITTVNVDQPTDDPSQARAEIYNAMLRVKDVIGARASASGVASLDASGLVPLAQIPATLTGKDADTVDGAHAGTAANNVLKLDASGLVPLANIPATLTGKSADALGGINLGGVFSGPLWPSIPRIGVDGVMEIGNYLDFHNVSGGPSDYDTRIMSGNGALYLNSNVMWHQGNDGAGSGLDADLLDGISSATFARQDATNNFTAAQNYFGGSVISTKACAAGYIRLSPNYCAVALSSVSLLTLTDNTCTSIAAPSADAKGVAVFAKAISASDGVTGSLSNTIVSAYSDASCVSPYNKEVAQVNAEVITGETAGDYVGFDTGSSTVPLGSVGGNWYLYCSVTKTQSVCQYRIEGYYD